MNTERYIYGMRLRGFSPGCQPMAGFVERQDDPNGKYHDVLVYNHKLTDKELRDYELDFLSPHVCPYGNERCLCQSCANSWLNCGESRCIECIDCDTQKKAAHDVYLCTGHKPVGATLDEKKGEGNNV